MPLLGNGSQGYCTATLHIQSMRNPPFKQDCFQEHDDIYSRILWAVKAICLEVLFACYPHTHVCDIITQYENQYNQNNHSRYGSFQCSNHYRNLLY